MTATDDDAQKVPTGRDAVDRLRSQGALDGLFEQIDVGQVKMTGADGLLPALVKEALERGLAAELTEHLGYEKGEPTSQARSNARNGTTPKTVDSEVGPFEIEVPRDRAGTFTPRLVRKGQRRLDGLDAMIISLYAGGIEKCATFSTIWPPRSAWSCPRGPFRRSPTRSLTLSWSGSAARWRSSTR